MALYGFLCDTLSTVQSISGATLPAGQLTGLNDRAICGLVSTSFANFSGNIVKVRNSDNPTGTVCYVVAPTATQGVIRMYSFSTTTILTRLWQVPDGNGNPIVPIGTTFSTINDVKVACGGAGVIYFDVNGMAVN